MSSPNDFRALVVDDEAVVRRLIAKALQNEGIHCDLAADGSEAAELASQSHYDLVVTDLRMPIKHGYAFALEMLNSEVRPVIFVLTGVVDPRLAKDLIARGVDDVLHKPIDLDIMATKAKALMARKGSGGNSTRAAASDSLLVDDDETPQGCQPIGLESLNQKMSEVATVLPISRAALDVYHMTRSCDWHISQIAAAIKRDASLAAEILKLANSSLYNASQQRVVNLDQAVMRIGQQRTGELAITVNALANLTPAALPWMDVELTWLRSMAAGVALEEIIELGGHKEVGDDLSISAMMYSLGRVALGVLFPKHYKWMIEQCWRTEEPLREQERRILPATHVEVLVQLLTSWNIPPDVTLPLKYAADDYAALARLPEPARTRAELVKVAVFIGRLAVGRWETWDLVDVPPAAVLERLGISKTAHAIAQVRTSVAKLAGFCPGGERKPVTESKPSQRIPIAYCSLLADREDLLAELLPSIGFELQYCTRAELRELSERSLVNALDASATLLAASRGSGEIVVIADRERAATFANFASVIAVPCSFGRFRDGLTSPTTQPSRQPALTG
jgi:DNA-binding response OmpR family regulator